MHRGTLLIFIFLSLLVLPSAVPLPSDEPVVINSEDWIDVYSGMLYARHTDNDVLFMTSRRYLPVLQKIILPGRALFIIESEQRPYVANMGSVLRRAGYVPRTKFSSDGFALNLELARELNQTRFIIIDPSYGFNAVSVAPYAIFTKAFVLFADDRNIDQVTSFLATRERIDSILVYGQVADVVLEKLESFSPEIINTGHRYRDNVAILTKYFQANPLAEQALLTGGEFLESQLIGGEPVILTSTQRLLDPTLNFVKNSNLKTIVVVGNELTGIAKQIKDATGIPLFVKIGQGIPTGVSNYEPIKALDMFFMPTLIIRVDLGSLRYNARDQFLEMSLRNKGARAHLSSTIRILVDGATLQTIGDADLQRLERNETRGFRYPIDLSEQIAQGSNLTAQIFTIYGESPEIIDHTLEAELPIIVSSADDECELDLRSVTFDERTQRISVKIKNPSKSDCYASINLFDVIIDDLPTQIIFPGTGFIPAGRTETFKIKQRMTPVDIADNPEVHVRVLYGAEEGLLFKIIDTRVPFGLAGEFTALIIAGVIIILVILVIVLFVLWRRSKKGETEFPAARKKVRLRDQF